MQKIYLSFALLLIVASLYGQCTPVNCLSTLPPYGGICDTILATGRVNQAYSDFESFHTTTACFDAVAIDSSNAGTYIKISSVHSFTFSGLPAGITATTNQPSYNSPANGCIAASGTPTQIGVFAITADFLANIIVTTSSCFNLITQNNNAASYALNLIVLPNPNFSISSTNFRVCDAAVPLTLTGTPGGNFSGPGVTGSTFNPALAGVGTHTISYVVSAQQGAAVAPATDSFSVVVTVTNFSLSNSSTAATCASNSGSATVTASGGTSPYSYAWSNGASTATANNIVAGSYTVTVTDASGCVNTSAVTVSSNSLTLTGSTSTINSGCGQSDGSATATPANGTSPYSYLWSSGGQTGQTATNLAAGNYSVTVTDLNGCEGVLNATVNNPNPPTASIQSSNNVSCNGGNDGAATVNPSGGSSPYSFLWSAAAQTTQMASALAAGTYSVTVQDAASCLATSTVTITEPTALSLNINSASTMNVSCNGGNDGAAGIMASGATAPYVYVWNNGATTMNITGLNAGSYTATVTDANNCTAGINIPITEPQSLAINVSGTNILCNGETNGSASAFLAGGVTPYSYSWSNSSSSSSITGLGPGTYSLSVTDANGCTMSSNTITITEPSVIASGITATAPSTAGGFNGNVNISPSGGTTPYSYLWSNGAVIQNLSNISAGVYSVTISDANGCTLVLSDTVQDGPTAINQIENNSIVSIFPNPASEMATLSIQSTYYRDAKIEIFNLIGQVMYSSQSDNIINHEYRLDLSTWVSGVYMVRVTIGDEIIVRRLIKS